LREYGRIHCAFWTSTDIQSMSEDGRWLAMYLLSSPHTTIIGAFRLPDGYICEDMKWTPERVSKGFNELLSKGFANRCGTTKWVWIRKFLEWNSPENPNQWKAARKVAAQIPDGCSWKAEFEGYFVALTDDPSLGNSNPSETVSKEFRNQEQEQEQEQEQKKKQNGHSSAVPTDVTQVFEHWKVEHNHPKSKLDTKRAKLIRVALQSYSAEQLCQSISGYKHSPHHMGKNDRNTVYDDIEIFLRDAKHIDAGLKFAEKGSEQKWM
jgi:hypothetical protein